MYIQIYILWILFIQQRVVNGNVCQPTLNVGSADYIHTPRDLTCDISQINNACLTNIRNVVWETQDGGVWKGVFQYLAATQTFEDIPTDFGYSLTDRSSGTNFASIVLILKITNTTYADAGMWRCKVISADPVSYESAESHFEIISESVCQPSIDVGTEQYSYTSKDVTCDISQINNVCQNNLATIIWEKQNNALWKAVFQYVADTKAFEVVSTDFDYTLSGRSEGTNFVDIIFILKITNATDSDTGMWRCKVVSTNPTTHESQASHLEIISNVQSRDIDIIRDATLELGKDQEYKCITNKPVYPEFDVQWETAETNGSKGSSYSKMDGDLWIIDNRITLAILDESNPAVTCYLFKASGLPLNIRKTSVPTEIKASGWKWWEIFLLVIGLLVAIVGILVVSWMIYKKTCT